MPTKNLHVLGIDHGGETGWCWLTVRRAAIFGPENPDVLEWDYGTFNGPEPGQSIAISRKAREIQSLDYKTGPAIMSERGMATRHSNRPIRKHSAQSGLTLSSSSSITRSEWAMPRFTSRDALRHSTLIPMNG